MKRLLTYFRNVRITFLTVDVLPCDVQASPELVTVVSRAVVIAKRAQELADRLTQVISNTSNRSNRSTAVPSNPLERTSLTMPEPAPSTIQDQINLLTGAMNQLDFSTTQIGDGVSAVSTRLTADVTAITGLQATVKDLEDQLAAATNTPPDTTTSDALGVLAGRLTVNIAHLDASATSLKEMGKDANTPVPVDPPDPNGPKDPPQDPPADTPAP